MNYNLCIAIPIKSTNIKEVIPIIDEALKAKPNLIELRLDYISKIKTLDIDFVRNLLNIIHPYAAVIFTLRDSSEGGQLIIHEKERFKILKMLIEVKPDYLDVEMNTDINILNDLITLALHNSVKIIFSYHNYEKTISFNESIEIVRNFNETLTQKLDLDLKKLRKNIYKVILHGNIGHLL
jgi:3-dehydroquinate dehydratase-1